MTWLMTVDDSLNSNMMLIRGNVVSNKKRRPNRSIKKTAGMAKTKLQAPGRLGVSKDRSKERRVGTNRIQ